MKERLEAARKRLEELEKIAEPDDATRGSIEYERGRIKYLERLTIPAK